MQSKDGRNFRVAIILLYSAVQFLVVCNKYWIFNESLNSILSALSAQ